MAEWAGAMADLAAGKPELAEPRLLAIVDGDAAVDAAIGLGLLYETRGDTADGRRVVRQGAREGPGQRRRPPRAWAAWARASASPLPALPTPGAPGGGND